MRNYLFQSVEVSAELLPLLATLPTGVPLMDKILHSQAILANLSDDDLRAYCVFTEDKRLVGFCLLGIMSLSIETEDSYYCEDMIDVACLAIHKEFQHQGIGTAILEYILDNADSILPNVEYLHVDALDMDDGSYSAVPFYKKFGFKLYARSGEDAARMFYSIYRE